MSRKFTEDTVEQAAIDWLQQTGYTYIHGGTIAPDEPTAERETYNDVILVGRLLAALERINGHIPRSARAAVFAEVIRKVKRVESQNPVINNHRFHRLFTEGVDVSFRDGGQTRHEKVWLADFEHTHHNDFLAVNQFTVTDVNHITRARTNRRPDVILFVNGLPLVVIELKNAIDQNATLSNAYNQLQTYKADIGTLFTYNGLLAISDGIQAQTGTLTSGDEWFKPWRTLDGETLDPHNTQLETLIKGVFAPRCLLDILRYFVVFEQDDAGLIKKVAGYHQYYAVNRAVDQTVRASAQTGDQRVGVVWHTQGSGKSLSMLFYGGKIIQHPAMKNPTLVILTDRNDLDDQLFGVFASGQELLRQEPIQAENRAHLRQLLSVASGGVVFTTIQKFQPDDDNTEYPLLSDRRNIIFIADEAHRSQYGFSARINTDGAMSYGFAKYVRDALPHASFIGFTGTPVEKADANTRHVFGGYIDVYDIQRAVDDGATVPIYYEARLAPLAIDADKRPYIDDDFEQVTEGAEQTIKEKLKTKWSQLEAMVGTDARLEQIAQDIITHFEVRHETLDGKAMIVCMSRRIAVDLYQHIIRERPQWHDETDAGGVIKIVMTGSAGDPPHFQPHVRNKPRRKALAERFKDPTDPLKLVIVRDMWLTGFDAPVMNTMYIDKPMRGHSLMQAIARVNRVFKDKPGGLIVDYLGIAADLQEAVDHYTQEGGEGIPAQALEQIIGLMLDQYHIVSAMFYHFDYSGFFHSTPSARLSVIVEAMEHILQQHDGKRRFMEAVGKLSKAFALAVPADETVDIREDVAFFQAVRSAFSKNTPVEGRAEEDIDSAVKQLVSGAIISDDVIDIFRSKGIKRPDVSILSDEFLEEVDHMPQQNVALELLRKLLNDEIRARSNRNVVQARSFADLLEQTIRRYQNRTIDISAVITELIHIAKDMRDATKRGAALGLTEDEVAFYDALADNKSAVEVMGDKQLAVIALELVKSVRSNVTIDWTVKETARAKIRVMVKRILRHFGYPPDLQDAATDLVLEQAAALAARWAE
ncbi:MAG: type I restriction endonuclease subunit R [Anaerolineaceae bacterium]|nr:MAG: type I restriction endonuclease subunit R [Anaerolineaceae bacterium]